MIDRESRYPGRIKLIPTEYPDIYDTEMADEPVVEGTSIEKATMLDDSTASAYGLSPRSATPNDAFKAAKDVFADKSTTSQALDAIKKSVNSNTANISANGTAIQENKKEVESLRASTAQTFANAFTKTVSGPVVAVDDVSPVVHQVGCTVERVNLASAQQVYETAHDYKDNVVEDGRTCVSFNSASSVNFTGVTFKPNQQYFVKFDAKVVNSHTCLFQFIYSDGTYSRITSHPSDWSERILTSDPGKSIVSIGTASMNYKETDYIDVNTFMFAEFNGETPYTPYVPDLSAVTVSRRTPNIFDMARWERELKAKWPDQVKVETVGGEEYLSFHVENGIYAYPFMDGEFHEKTSYRIRFKAFSSAAGGIRIDYTDNSFYRIVINSKYPEYFHFSTPASKTIKAISMFYPDVYDISYRDFEIEEADQATDTYIPYVLDTYAPAPDGTVSGITSLSPSMTILTDNPGVTLEATYNRDSNKVIQGLMDRIAALESAKTEI